jgi:ribosome maturation factor RimP
LVISWVRLAGRCVRWAGGPFFVVERLLSEGDARRPFVKEISCSRHANPCRGGPGFLVDTNSIAQMIEPSLTAMGYRLVRVVMTSGRRATLQVMTERLDDLPITLDDCTQISHSVSSLLDVANPILGGYTLEISSPGIDRPLVRKEDYDRFSGFEAKIELAVPLDGRRRFRGRLLGTSGSAVRLLTEAGEARLPLDTVARAKLVLTDDLIARAGHKPLEPFPPQSAIQSRPH